MAGCPAPLKSILPYLRHADQLDRAGVENNPKAPMIAYFCRAYAMDLAIKLHKSPPANTPECQAYLLNLMTVLEGLKKDLPEYTPQTAKDFVYTFALGVFKKADDVDREGAATKETAKTYYAASAFFDIMKQFGELDDDVAKMCRYAKWKTSDILKALKEGRRPKPGPPGGDDSDAGGGAFGGGAGGGGAGGGVEDGNSGAGGGGVMNLPGAIPPAAPMNPPVVSLQPPVQPAAGGQLPYNEHKSYDGPGVQTFVPKVVQPGPVQPVVQPAVQPAFQQPPMVPGYQVPANTTSAMQPGVTNMEDALELAKFAVRSLEMRDKKTAVTYLQQALASLQ